MNDEDLEYNDRWTSSEYDHKRKSSEEFNEWWIKSNNLINCSTEDSALSSSQKVVSGKYGHFQVVWLKNIDRLTDLLPEHFSLANYSLLDVGCGSAISTLYFLQFYAFKSYQGFDFRKNLIRDAKENLTRYQKLHNCFNEPKFFVGDAAELKIVSSTPHFLYMYNPFDYSVARTFFKNNINFLREKKCVVAIANDIWIKGFLNDFKDVRIIRNPKHNLSMCFFR